jgi:hypothetical protein
MQLVDQQLQRTLHDQRRVSIRNDVPQQILSAAQVVMCRG